jgi:hypothetical protein
MMVRRRADAVLRLLLRIVDRGGLRHPQATSDLLPLQSLLSKLARLGATLEHLRGDLLVQLLGGGKQILELIDLEHVAARPLFLQPQALLASRIRRK